MQSSVQCCKHAAQAGQARQGCLGRVVPFLRPFPCGPPLTAWQADHFRHPRRRCCWPLHPPRVGCRPWRCPRPAAGKCGGRASEQAEILSRRLDIADSEGACQWATLGEAAASLPHQQTSLSRGRKEQRVLRVCCWRRAAFCGGVGRRPLRHRHKAEAHLIKKYNYVVFLAVQVVQVADGPAGGRQQRGQWAPLAADMALRQLPLEGDAQATSMQLLADRV